MGIGAAPEGTPGHVTVYVDVDDIDAYLAKAEQLGGKILMQPEEVPGFGVTFALFADPEGHVVGMKGSGSWSPGGRRGAGSQPSRRA